MLLRDHRNSRKQGDAGIGAAIAFFTSNGYPVSIPLTDSQEYDLVIDIDGCLKKVQVKTVYHRNKWNWFCVHLRTCGGNRSFSTYKMFDNSLVDFLFIVTENCDKYFIPAMVIKVRNTLVLGHRMERYKLP